MGLKFFALIFFLIVLRERHVLFEDTEEVAGIDGLEFAIISDGDTAGFFTNDDGDRVGVLGDTHGCAVAQTHLAGDRFGAWLI